jgi:ABC-type arginine transport system permease subunit
MPDDRFPVPTAGHYSVAHALREITLHPLRLLVLHWNWKSAILSAMLRGIIFLIATARRGVAEISTAVAVEAVFSAGVSGIYGAVVQTLRYATPEWLATFLIAAVLPPILLALDFGVHYYTGMRHQRISLVMSGILSALSSIFSLYVMRRGALLVAHEGDSFARDLARLPGLILTFLLVIPNWIRQLLPNMGNRHNLWVPGRTWYENEQDKDTPPDEFMA